MRNPFHCFNSSAEVIRLTVLLYVRYPLSLRQVEDLLFERATDICHETVRFWRNRFGPMFAAGCCQSNANQSPTIPERGSLSRQFSEAMDSTAVASSRTCLALPPQTVAGSPRVDDAINVKCLLT